MTMSAPKRREELFSTLPIFLGGAVIAVFLGALFVVLGSPSARTGHMIWRDVLIATADAGFRGSIVALPAAGAIWYPVLRKIVHLPKAGQFPIMIAAGAATAIPVAIIDSAFNLHPGFSGILAIYAFFAGIWSSAFSLLFTWLLAGSRRGRLVGVTSAAILLSAGVASYVARVMGTDSWAIF